MKINVHAGHNPDGKIACGAVGLIKESTEARKVKKEVIRLLRKKGHKVYDCTCTNGTSQTDVLKRIVTKCNKHKVDLDISIHLIVESGIRKAMVRRPERKCMCTVRKAQRSQQQNVLLKRLRLLALKIAV